MRLIEERVQVIGPGAIVRLTKNAARGSIKDLMARWRVLGVEEYDVRVEDENDSADTRTFHIDDLERVKGGPWVPTSLVASETSQYPEHDRWPACLREDESAMLDAITDGDGPGNLFDTIEEAEADEEDLDLDELA